MKHRNTVTITAHGMDPGIRVGDYIHVTTGWARPPTLMKVVARTGYTLDVRPPTMWERFVRWARLKLRALWWRLSGQQERRTA